MKITLSSGTTIRVETTAHEKLSIILDNPGAPAEHRNAEVGRIIELEGRHGFQPAPFSAYALTPEVLRAIAEIIEKSAK